MGPHDRLRRALIPPGNEPFTLVFQPVVNLVTQKVTSLEALIRWSAEPAEVFPPSEFVPLAERTGLAPHLDRWVLRTACHIAATWTGCWSVSVNVSAATFGLIDVAELAASALASSGLPPSRLLIEMTETALATDEDRARRAVEALRRGGVRVALDDFGGGHASLAALRRYPFSMIKIDRRLVSGVHRDPIATRTVAFVAEIGALLGTSVVAEGVETAEELRTVARCGVGGAQGFFLSRPVSVGEVPQAIESTEATAKSTLAVRERK